MDRSYCSQKKRLTVYYYALQLFRESIIYSDAVKEKLRLHLLQQITLERKGLIIDRDLMKHLISMLIALGSDCVTSGEQPKNASNSVDRNFSNLNSSNLLYKIPYEEEFEIFYLIETEQYYRTESLEYISCNSSQEYLNKIEKRLTEEVARVSNYLCSTTESKVKAILDTELISNHARALLEMDSTGLDYMLLNHKLDDITRLYNMFSRVSTSMDLLRDSLGKYVEGKGLEILNSNEVSKDPILFVRQILELKEKFDEIIHRCMKDEKKVLKKLKEAFESFLNKDNRAASYLASYVDELFKSDPSIQSAEEELENQLDRIMVIFRFLADKDIFENYYKSLLAKRLLSGRIISDENERSIIARLKAECGYQFTSKLEGMLMDISISKSVMAEFRKSSLNGNVFAGVEFEVHLLTAGYWPLEVPGRFPSLPLVMQTCCSTFSSFYAERNNGRKLLWMANMGQVDLKGNFTPGRKDLIVSTYQAIILLLFNQNTTFSLNQLKEATGIADIELKRHLLSLCTNKVKILIKSSRGKGIENDDEFTFNSEYTSKMKRIKVPLVAKKEVSPDEEISGEIVPLAVEEDRRHLVEAAIVRIMKSRKTVSHNELIAEVTKQIVSRFSPSPQFIKRRIESLIEREYLQRNETDSRLYNYLA
eukprot:CAMPEP_0173157644 /NCGR_PEP_ID=MMETSP1105-20130129/15763_1 /TAXON_ID=2985 /ORGANISM="Ochromonas sp., Strain BG-1" /LENGTH=649 /DNA_ID=CAMNT_0014075179 /DNA_START=281 /DNA_END=2230 /DNA_ORIENTATION=+